ncbi:hypothetical protein BSZ35_07500 [Salinibacter sp. 10B]|nr:hypothetical protein BSZ35_07500 [Salinibacter sp. 10B]
MYANEYRREYRMEGTDDYGYAGYNDLYEYKYQYKYKYGALSPYRSLYGGWCDDAFFHDPWYYYSQCGPSYGSRFSLSFHFGTPYYHHRPWGRRYYSSWYGYRYGGWPYSNYYFGNQYYYYGDADWREDERDYLSRRATIRGTTDAGQSASRGPTARASSVERARHSSSSGGRIGRSREASMSQRGRVGDRTARSWEIDRLERMGDGRIGRSRRATMDRSRTRSDDRVRRSFDDDRRSGYRLPSNRSDSRIRDRSRSSNRGQAVGRGRSNDRSRATSPRRVRSSSDRSTTRTRSSSRDRSRSSSSDRSRDRGGDSDDNGSR